MDEIKVAKKFRQIVKAMCQERHDIVSTPCNCCQFAYRGSRKVCIFEERPKDWEALND